MKGADIENAHQTLVIGSADPGTASLLQVPLGTPTAECHCVVTNRKGVAIYVAEIIYRNDCVKLYIDLLDKSKPRVSAGSAAKNAPSGHVEHGARQEGRKTGRSRKTH